jgi:hypothetical protein
VILPKENQRDLHDLPIELLRSLEIHFVGHISEVFPLVIRSRAPVRRVAVKKPALRTGLKRKPKPRVRSHKPTPKRVLD